jgi:transposase
VKNEWVVRRSEIPEAAIRFWRKTLKEMLPNAKVVGDHFHFKQAIEEGLNNIRVYVQKDVKENWPKLLLKKLLKQYTQGRNHTPWQGELNGRSQGRSRRACPRQKKRTQEGQTHTV